LVNAYQALQAAQDPIAAVAVPTTSNAGSATFDGSGSVAACGQTIAGYAWSAAGGVMLESAANQPHALVTWNGDSGALTLTVTDSAGRADTATVFFTASGPSTSAPASAGSAAQACPTAFTFRAQPPTVTAGFLPTSIPSNGTAVLTLTFSNANPFALTQAAFAQTLPANLSVAPAPAPTTSCSGASLSLTSTAGTVTLSNANIPAASSCYVSLNVMASAAGTFTAQVAAQALTTAPAGGNGSAATATLNVTAAGAGGGGGASTWLDLLFSASLLLWVHARVHGRA
jgi:hypothetical protein